MDCSGGVNAADFGTFFVPKFKNARLGGTIRVRRVWRARAPPAVCN